MDEGKLEQMKKIDAIEGGISEPFGGPTHIGPPRLKETIALSPSEVKPEVKTTDFVDSKLFENQASMILLALRKKLRENERLIDVALTDAENEECLFSLDVKDIKTATQELREVFRGVL